MKSVSLIAVLAIAGAAQAQIQVTDLGTGAPPAVLGGYNMIAFGDDARAIDFSFDTTALTGAEGAPFGTLGFSNTTSHRSIGNGWATWSNGYTGDVYYNQSNDLTMTLPTDTGAFYFYAEPDSFTPAFDMTATANDGTTLTVSVLGDSGANGFGFWTNGPALTSITISCPGNTFAVGEFGIARAVPTPGALALLGLGGLAAGRRRR